MSQYRRKSIPPLRMPDVMRGCAGSVAVLVVVVLIILIISGTRRVDAGEVCVRLRFGQTNGVAEPGLHVVMPFVDSFKCYSQRVVVYEVSSTPASSDADYPDFSTSFNTPDGQEALANYTLIWRIDPGNAECAYEKTGRTMDEVNVRSVKAISRSRVRLLAGRYTAGQLFSGRLDPDAEIDVTAEGYETVLERLEGDIRLDLAPRLDEQCVTLVDFLLRKFTFNEDYVRAREQLSAAEAESQRVSILADGEANAARTRAEGQADALDTIAEKMEGFTPETARLLIQQLFIESFAGQITWGLVPEGINPFIQIPAPSTSSSQP